MNVAPDVLAVLDRAAFAGNAVMLNGQLDKPLYSRVAKVIEAAGGKWNRKAAAHLFPDEAYAAIEPILLTGKVTSAKQKFGAFFTPDALADIVIARAALRPGLQVLEPSAGRGALAAPALLAGCLVDCVEIDNKSVRILASTAYRQVVEADFLSLPAKPTYDRVVMNPPFAKNQDCAHVEHALRFLHPGGRLVAIMSSGILFRETRAHRTLRDTIRQAGGTVEPLSEGAFKASGTAVNTVLVVIDRNPFEQA